jgi:hypothetical protein
MAGFSIFNIPKSQINKKAIAITITGSPHERGQKRISIW